VPAGSGEQCSIGFQACIERSLRTAVKSATTWEWLKAVAQSVRYTGWKPMLLGAPVQRSGTPSLKDLFLRVQAGIFSDRAQPALHPES
jgi:hypothetical protein